MLSTTTKTWPPDYKKEYARRQALILKLRSEPGLIKAAKAYYSKNCVAFINDWGVTYDPRNVGTDLPVYMPFVTFRRQDEFIEFLLACFHAQADGLNEKSRDMGSTWLAVSFSVWLWLFWPGAAVGWGSRKADLVDRLGDPDSIFEKIRIFIRYLPREFMPDGFESRDHMTYMRLLNPETGATITGESGDNIGRGGRKLIYFKDESAHYEHPEAIEAALGDNTRIQIDISSVHGLGTVFQRKREAGVVWLAGSPAIQGVTNIFIADWRDHPAKDQDWYNKRKAKAVADGLLHIFAQEVDRDYSASVEGLIIPADWVTSAIDAHLKLDYLGDWDAGMYCAALDVADEGLDRNALAIRKGPVLRHISEWGERDVGATARRSIAEVATFAPLDLEYDCIGVGAGVKSEANRLEEENALPRGLTLVPWNAGSAVLRPEERVIPGDKNSPKNKDFYRNLKAQGWWQLRLRFERTHRAVTEGEEFDVDDLISLPSDLPLLAQLRKELSQPTTVFDSRLKLVVDKKPEGARSPNLGDAVMMNYFPIIKLPRGVAVFGTQHLQRREE